MHPQPRLRGLAALSVLLIFVPVLAGCGGDDDTRAGGTETAEAAPTSGPDPSPSVGSVSDAEASPADSDDDSVAVFGSLPCEDPPAEGLLQIALDDSPCVGDRTEQCSIVGDGATGLIRSTSQLEWSDLADAVLKANLGGQIVEATGTVTVQGLVAEFVGEMPDGRPIIAAANCTSGP